MAEEPGAVVVVSTARSGAITQTIQAGSHSLLSDEPEGEGSDEGPTPYELLLAALGACTSMTLSMYAKHKGLALEHVSVRLTYNRVHIADCAEGVESNRRRVHRIERAITLVGDLSDDERERLLQIAERCAVHRTLVEEKEIVTRLA